MSDPDTFAVVAGGGTAGHLLPGLSVARALVARGHAPSSIHFVGSDRGVERDLVPQAGFTLDELPGRGIQRRLTLANVGAAFGILRGFARAFRILRRRRPAVILATGGHASVPCAVVAVILRIPLVLVEQNRRAGAANRLVRWFARASAVSFEGTDLPRAVVTGNPLRPEIVDAARHADPAGARERLGVPPGRTVVAAFAGSLGSRRINTAVRQLVHQWAERDDLTVIHVVGRRDWNAYRTDLPQTPAGGIDYRPVEYEDHMEVLLAAADVAVTRSGGSVFELAALGVPAILVPLPIAPRDHQRANADAVARAGGAVVVPDDELDAARLGSELAALVGDEGRRAAMRAAMLGLARLDAADAVAIVAEEHAR